LIREKALHKTFGSDFYFFIKLPQNDA
jgi:hypothetical protein